MARLTITASAFCVLLATLEPVAARGAGAIEDKGRLDAVTVYRGQALITRIVAITGDAGLREVVITDLPEQVVPGSLYAESSDGIEVRSVIFRQKPVAQDVREEVRAIDLKIREVQDQIWTNTQSLTLLASRIALLDKLEQFTARTANVELTQGVLDPAALKEITAYLIEQREAASQADLQLQMEKRDLNERLEVLQRERQQLAGVPAQTAREAVVFVNIARPGGELRLRYLVNQATWSPSYTVRAGDDRSTVNVEYHASIQQLSGEDWDQVAMTLSTATPSLVAKAPALDPLRISLTSIAEQAAAQYGQLEFAQKRAEIQQEQVMQNVNRAQRAGQRKDGQGQLAAPTADIDWTLNDLACKLQVLELASQGDIRAPEQHTHDFDAGLSVTYQLVGRTNLPSRSDRQLIQIASLPMSADFYKVAIPVLSDSIFEEARMVNSSAVVLLAGPVSTYLAGQFVGHGDMPTVAAGQDLTLGFGIDSSLRVSRELVGKTESIQGGNRVVDLNYELILENFGTNAAKVRILDRKPIAEGSQVKLTLVSSAPEQSVGSADKTNGKNGIMRWDVEVPARSNGAATTTVAYHLRLEYDKQMSITGLAMGK